MSESAALFLIACLQRSLKNSANALPQRCELKINKLKIKTSINIESCVDCNYNIGIKNGSCEIGATSRYKICVSQSSGCGF